MNEAILMKHYFLALAEHYAQACDRNRPDILSNLFTEDAIIEGPGFRLSGLAEILGIPPMLRSRYLATRHLVHNQIVVSDGDQASGETYCTASHVIQEVNRESQTLVWHMRYLDQFNKPNGEWRFSKRSIVIDWTETRSITLLPA